MVRATSSQQEVPDAADERVHDDAVLVTCMRHWRALAPLHRWLTDNLQAA
jgi:hypothetical protein